MSHSRSQRGRKPPPGPSIGYPSRLASTGQVTGAWPQRKSRSQRPLAQCCAQTPAWMALGLVGIIRHMSKSRPNRFASVLGSAILPVVAFSMPLGGCEKPNRQPPRVKNARMVMGTTSEVTAYAADRDTAQNAVNAAYTRLEHVNRLMSDYVDDSEVGRLNALPAGESLVVSVETFRCLNEAAKISALSGGAFDITCRPLVWLWKDAGKQGTLPAPEQIEDTLARVGWQKVRLDDATRSVTPAVPNMQIDLGGIAKGYALDLAAEAMRTAGATSGVIDVGGDVRVLGSRPDGQPWTVGVRHPADPDALYCLIQIEAGAVATSGVQQRFTIIEGKRYSHIIDPRTGRPAEEAPSVTVIAPDGLTADGWATALSVLSVDEGRQLIESGAVPKVEVLWLHVDGEKIMAHQTRGFAGHIVQ